MIGGVALAIVLLLVVAQLVLPGIAAQRLRDRLGRSGTVQKVVLSMISTGVFTRLGHVYRGRMVDLVAGNEKLRRRAAAIVADLTGAQASRVGVALRQAGGNPKLAILMLRTGLSPEAASTRLHEAEGDLAVALGEA